jgi:hypothetical protein
LIFKDLREDLDNLNFLSKFSDCLDISRQKRYLIDVAQDFVREEILLNGDERSTIKNCALELYYLNASFSENHPFYGLLEREALFYWGSYFR